MSTTDSNSKKKEKSKSFLKNDITKNTITSVIANNFENYEEQISSISTSSKRSKNRVVCGILETLIKEYQNENNELTKTDILEKINKVKDDLLKKYPAKTKIAKERTNKLLTKIQHINALSAQDAMPILSSIDTDNSDITSILKGLNGSSSYSLKNEQSTAHSSLSVNPIKQKNKASSSLESSIKYSNNRFNDEPTKLKNTLLQTIKDDEMETIQQFYAKLTPANKYKNTKFYEPETIFNTIPEDQQKDAKLVSKIFNEYQDIQKKGLNPSKELIIKAIFGINDFDVLGYMRLIRNGNLDTFTDLKSRYNMVKSLIAETEDINQYLYKFTYNYNIPKKENGEHDEQYTRLYNQINANKKYNHNMLTSFLENNNLNSKEELQNTNTKKLDPLPVTPAEFFLYNPTDKTIQDAVFELTEATTKKINKDGRIDKDKIKLIESLVKNPQSNLASISNQNKNQKQT